MSFLRQSQQKKPAVTTNGQINNKATKERKRNTHSIEYCLNALSLHRQSLLCVDQSIYFHFETNAIANKIHLCI